MNLTKIYLFHKDPDTEKGFLVWLEGRRSFGCICKRCLSRVYEGTSTRVRTRLRFKLSCGKCRVTQHCDFEQKDMKTNLELFKKISDSMYNTYKGVK